MLCVPPCSPIIYSENRDTYVSIISVYVGGVRMLLFLIQRVFHGKNPSFKKAMSGRASGRLASGERLASSEVYLLVNLSSKCCVTFILEWKTPSIMPLGIFLVFLATVFYCINLS